MKSWWPEPLVIPSSRAAVLVVSPIAVYSIRRCEPTCPDITVPLLRPIPIAKPSPWPSACIQRVEARQSQLEHLACRRDRPVGVVGLLERGAEDGHDPVAHVGDEGAAVVHDRVAHLLQVVVEDVDHRVRRQLLGRRW